MKKPLVTEPLKLKIAELTIARKELVDLKPHPRNPRIHPEKGTPEWSAFVDSLRNDYFDPLVWNKRNGMLVSGHLRKKILDDLGYTAADVIVVDYPEKVHLARLIQANRQHGRNDLTSLKELLSGIKSEAIKLTGMTNDEIEALYADYGSVGGGGGGGDTPDLGSDLTIALIFDSEAEMEKFSKILSSLKKKHKVEDDSEALLKELTEVKSKKKNGP